MHRFSGHTDIEVPIKRQLFQYGPACLRIQYFHLMDYILLYYSWVLHDVANNTTS